MGKKDAERAAEGLYESRRKSNKKLRPWSRAVRSTRSEWMKIAEHALANGYKPPPTLLDKVAEVVRKAGRVRHAPLDNEDGWWWPVAEAVVDAFDVREKS